MAVNHDADSTSGYEASLSTYGWSHVCAGDSRLLVVGVSIFLSGTVTSITYNSVGLTFIRADAQGAYRSELWYLIKPALGSNTITVNLSVSLTSIAGATSLTGVDQNFPVTANNGANGTNNPASVSITTVKDNDWVIDTLATSLATAPTVGSGQAQRWNQSGALGSGTGSTKGPISPPAATTMQWTGLGVPDSWALSAAAIKAAVPTYDNPFILSVPNTHMGIRNRVVSY